MYIAYSFNLYGWTGNFVVSTVCPEGLTDPFGEGTLSFQGPYTEDEIKWLTPDYKGVIRYRLISPEGEERIIIDDLNEGAMILDKDGELVCRWKANGDEWEKMKDWRMAEYK